MNIEILEQLFQNKIGVKPHEIKQIKQSGSNRKYYRLVESDVSIVGCFNSNVKENEAFFHLTEVFYKQNLPVPELLAIDESRQYYLQSDLGDEVLFDRVVRRPSSDFDDELLAIYKGVLDNLIEFQTVPNDSFDMSKFYPIHSFNKESVGWDLEYFKNYFLKLHDIDFSDRDLAHDFNTLIDHVLHDNTRYFMYRDFQSRNILLKNGQPWFIDYQGGRRGPLGYDVASLLYQAKAKISDSDRNTLLTYYIQELMEKVDIDEKRFLNYYYPIALIRVLQTLGAYGYRGIFQKKSHFLQSIGFALDNLKSLLPKLVALDHVPTLKRCLHELVEKREVYQVTDSNEFQIVINSFSYINGGVPADFSGHGGGYAFDCRMLPNPGRLEEYKQLTGMDSPVQEWLKKHNEVDEYINNTFTLIKSHIEAYQKRGFKYLSVNFGCTGGQHRSVYCTEQTARRVKELYPNAVVKVNHLMQNKYYQL
jgi:aminoglycoside/choline kinase family phosphotransferase